MRLDKRAGNRGGLTESAGPSHFSCFRSQRGVPLKSNRPLTPIRSLFRILFPSPIQEAAFLVFGPAPSQRGGKSPVVSAPSSRAFSLIRCLFARPLVVVSLHSPNPPKRFLKEPNFPPVDQQMGWHFDGAAMAGYDVSRTFRTTTKPVGA